MGALEETVDAGRVGPPMPDVAPGAVRDALMGLGDLHQLEGFGVFGSLGGQQAAVFDAAHSDIDVFVVVKAEHDTPDNCERWVRRITDVLRRRFRRGVDVLVFTLPMLRKVPGWHAISMASDCPVLYDPEGRVGDVLRRVVGAARAAGLAQRWVGGRRIWAREHLAPGENIVVEVPDDDGPS